MFSTAAVGCKGESNREAGNISELDNLGIKFGNECAPPSTHSSTTRVVLRDFSGEHENAWDAYVYDHASGTPFHLTAWKRVVEKVFQFEARYLLLEEAGRIRGVLPLFLVPNLLFGRCLMSTPFAVYGGICADDGLTAAYLQRAACEMAKRERVQYLELREQLPFNSATFQTKKLYVAFDLDLPRSVDELLAGFPRDTRYMIRKANKNQLYSIVSVEHLDQFHHIYCRSLHQLGTPAFPKKLFRTILQEFAGKVELTTVWKGKEALSAVLSFLFRDSILPYFGGSLDEGRQFAANNFMYYEVMRRALHAGYRRFDFGRSKLGSGSCAFKRQWNMRERALPYQFFLVLRKTMPNYSPANPKFKAAISVWKSLPFPVTRWLGPVMVRAFS